LFDARDGTTLSYFGGIEIMQIDNTLSQYIADISEFPMLAIEVEQDLATRWRENGDERAV